METSPIDPPAAPPRVIWIVDAQQDRAYNYGIIDELDRVLTGRKKRK